jgi:glycosyltransferase involved in cell wall biosynthesis
MICSEMRVCLLHNYGEDAQMSMKLYADKLGEALVSAGLDVQRVRPREILPQRLRKNRIAAKLDSYAGRFVKYPLLARTLDATVFHIVDHSHAHLVDRLPAERTVVTCHDLILLVLRAGRIRSEFRAPLAPHVLKHVVQRLRRARIVVADSEQTRRDVIEFVGVQPDRIEVVHPGVNYDFRIVAGARERARQRWNLGSNHVIVHVGQTGFYKNVEGVLRVLAEVRRTTPDVKLLRAGQRLDASHGALAQSLGLSDAIVELGGVSASDLRDVYNAGDVLLFPSLYEGFGWPPIEAMACGLPVVCSRAGSLDEIVGDAALTSDAEDVASLAVHVTRLFDDALLRESIRARGIANAQRFRWEKSAGMIAALYQRIAS